MYIYYKEHKFCNMKQFIYLYTLNDSSFSYYANF